MSSTWDYWYARKGTKIEPDVPELEELFARAGVSRILDYGCGIGRHTLYFARKGYDTYGFDKSETAISSARNLLAKENLGANLIVWDMARKLPYEDAFFDAVLAVRVIHHTTLDQIRRIFAEINSILRVSGYLFMQVPEYEEHLRALKEDKVQVIEPGTHVPLEGEEMGVPHHCFTKEELLGFLANFSIENIHLREHTHDGFCVTARKLQ
jgi:SAM-dependent methyltransferase